MARARQNRRLAKTWAARLGTADGIEAVDDFVFGVPADGDWVAELLATVAPGQLGWDEGAAQANTAELSGCPAGF